jgi:hypothetical protein
MDSPAFINIPRLLIFVKATNGRLIYAGNVFQRREVYKNGTKGQSPLTPC